MNRAMTSALRAGIPLLGTACLSAAVLLAGAADASAAVLQLYWEKVPEAATYLVYWGKSPGEYGPPKAVATSGPCQYRLSGLDPDALYYIAMRSANAGGLEGPLSAEVFSARTKIDSDGDGMSDDWELSQGLDPHDPTDASSDADHDGYSSLQEYEAGSDSGAASPPGSPVDSTPGGSGSGGPCFVATAAYGSPMAEEVVALRIFRDRWLMDNRLGRVFVGLYYALSPAAARFISGGDRLRCMVRVALMPVVGVCSVADTGYGRQLMLFLAAVLIWRVFFRLRHDS
ncbi:MAG: fibronectin type III domain-containing protein [Pseudomonadota bacterium]